MRRALLVLLAAVGYWLGAAWAWLGAAWALPGRCLGAARAWLGYWLGAAWAWLGVARARVEAAWERLKDRYEDLYDDDDEDRR